MCTIKLVTHNQCGWNLRDTCWQYSLWLYSLHHRLLLMYNTCILYGFQINEEAVNFNYLILVKYSTLGFRNLSVANELNDVGNFVYVFWWSGIRRLRHHYDLLQASSRSGKKNTWPYVELFQSWRSQSCRLHPHYSYEVEQA